MNAADIVYLDNNATTRVDDRVVAAILPLLTEQFGNASSTHHFGAQVGAAVEQARSQVAGLVGCRERELIFTSGATEANNAALRGVLAARPNKRHIVISTIEHAAILEPAAALENAGVRVTRIGVDRRGALDLDQLRTSLSDETALVSIMHVNNETGAILPLADVVEIAHAAGVPVHTDAVQAVGRIPVDFGALGVDLLSLTAHKLHGPKGVGALVVKRGAPFVPQIVGGPQERERRGGTYNTPGIVGFGVAAELAAERVAAGLGAVAALRDRLEQALRARVAGATVIAADQPRVANTSCICFPGVEAEAALLLLSEAGICVSSGAACSSGSLEPSVVLQAMKIDPYLAQGQLRFSLSPLTTEAEIERAVDAVPPIIDKVAAVNAT